MAEEYGYGRYREDYDYEDDDYAAADYGDEGDDADHDAADHGAAERLDAADYDDHGAADDTPDYEVRHDDDPERVDAADAADYGGDDHLLMEAAVDDRLLLDDPAVHESASSDSVRRMKRGRGFQARARRDGPWIPPDLRRFGQPVFWPADEPHVARGPAERISIWVYVYNQLFQTPLASAPELARATGLDEDEVTEAAQLLQRRGLCRSVTFGCLLRPTARYWVAPERWEGTTLQDLQQAYLSWHSDDGIGSLIRYSAPRVESIYQVAVQYATTAWGLHGVAWVEGDAIQAVALYQRRDSESVKSVVHFVWVSQWDTEREIWERLADVPAAVRRITEPGIAGQVVLVGTDRWAVARALPMAVESLMTSKIEPADIAAWTYAGGWQAASGSSLLDGAAQQPFRPRLAAAQLEKFVWPRARRKLGRIKLDTVINSGPWTRRDARTLYRVFNLVAEHPGCSIAHYAALGGKRENDRLAWRCIRDLLELGLVREAGIAGVANLPARERSQFFSERGQGQMRYRVSLSPKVEVQLAAELAAEQAGEQAGEPREDHTRPRANGADRLRLNHGHLSYREIVRRSGLGQGKLLGQGEGKLLGKLLDRLGARLVHEDVLVDVLGRFTILGCEVVPASRASTVTLDGQVIASDSLVYCSSPVANGYHRFELELSHLNPSAVRARLEKYARQFIPYPLLVVCSTNLGARHFDRIGEELGVPVVATSIPRLREMGFSGPAWLHCGRDVHVTPVPGPPQPAAL